MADFLIVVGDGPGARRWHERGLAIARAQGFGAPTAELVRPGVRAATFARRGNPSGPELIERDDRWALAAGSMLPANRASHVLEHGLDATLAVTDGFFALATGDPDGARVATDAIGSHHVHTRCGAGVTAVAGSALWLAALDDDRLDSIGCQEMLATGVIYGDRTPWASVRALPGASVVDVTGRGIGNARRWWSIADLEPGSVRGDAAVDAFGDAMLRTCERTAGSLSNVVSDLTAGWDSRLLVGFLLRAGVQFETTVTGPADSADVVLSQRIADAVGLRHTALPVGGPPTADEIFDATELTDGLVNAIGYARVLRVHRQLSQVFGASLNGSFGEVARGYWWEILRPSPDHVGPLDAEHVSRVRYAAGAPPMALWPEAGRLDPVEHFAEVVRGADREFVTPAPLSLRLDRTYLRLRMRSWQGRIASSTDRLWPCLSPLIARRALEILLQVPARERIHNRFARRVLARFAPELAALPLESGGPAVPRTLANAWRFAPEAWHFARRAGNKVLGRRNHSRTLEETSAPRLALWREERVRAALDPSTMALAEHIDADALRRTLDAMQRPDWPYDLEFGNLLALELGLARARELRRR